MLTKNLTLNLTWNHTSYCNPYSNKSKSDRAQCTHCKQNSTKIGLSLVITDNCGPITQRNNSNIVTWLSGAVHCVQFTWLLPNCQVTQWDFWHWFRHGFISICHSCISQLDDISLRCWNSFMKIFAMVANLGHLNYDKFRRVQRFSLIKFIKVSTSFLSCGHTKVRTRPDERGGLSAEHLM